MKKARILVASFELLAIGLMVGGCTSAGPFVTNISSDGKGNLIVEKNTVHMNAFMGTISSGDHPTTQIIQVFPEDRKRKRD
jgi:type IV secretion system protein VirB7